jgi:hypothetical protein
VSELDGRIAGPIRSSRRRVLAWTRKLSSSLNWRRHIDDARARIIAQRALIERGLEPDALAQANRFLKALEDDLAALEAHRALIAQTLADIEAGKL